MIDFELIEKSLKIAWIKRFAENNHAAWKIIPEHTLSQHGGIILKLGLSPGGYIKNYLEIQIKLHWWIKSVLKLFTIKMFPTFRSQSRTFFRGSKRKIMQKHSYKQDAD